MTTHLEVVPDDQPLPIPGFQLVQVARVDYMTGLEGSVDNPVRQATVYYGLDGEPLWASDRIPQ